MTNFDNEMLGFYTLNKRGMYVDQAPRSELGRRSRRSLGFGTFFFDVDLDGRLDLLVVNGHIDDFTTVQRDVQYAQPPHLFLNRGKQQGFQDVARKVGAGFAEPKVGRGAAFADFDRDGDLDVLITTNHGPAYLYRNDQLAGNRSIRFRLIGTKSNRDAIGATVRIFYGGEASSRLVKSGSSYLSQSELAPDVRAGQASDGGPRRARRGRAGAWRSTRTWPPGARSSAPKARESATPAASEAHAPGTNRGASAIMGLMTRRALLAMMAAQAGVLRAQRGGGMATRGVKPTPRGKAFRAPLQRQIYGCGGTGGTARAGHFRLRGPLRLHRGDDGLRRRVHRLRQRRLDRYLPAFAARAWTASTPDATNRLYKNNRDGTFTDVTEKAGLRRNGWAFGVTVGDYNNDGFEDLFVTYWGQNVLYRNNGDGTFTDVTKEAGLLEPDALGLRLHLGRLRPGRQARPVRCQLSHVRSEEDSRRRARRELQLERHSRQLRSARAAAGIAPAVTTTTATARSRTSPSSSGIGKVKGSFGLTAVAADFDDDGWPDIYVACDSTPSLMFRNNHDGTFTEEGLERGSR